MCAPEDTYEECIPHDEECYTDDAYDGKTCCEGATCVENDDGYNLCVRDGDYDDCIEQYEPCSTDDDYDGEACCEGTTCVEGDDGYKLCFGEYELRDF